MRHNVRVAAASVVAAVGSGRSLDDAIADAAEPLEAPDRALLRAISFGVVRERSALEWLAEQLLAKPLRNEPQLQGLLLCGLFQLRSMRVPQHAAVSETVAAVAELKKDWAKGLFNAVLRRYAREGGALDVTMPPAAAIRLSYPEWLVAAIKRDWPESWRSVLAAGNQPGPLTLRVNRRQAAPEAYRARLQDAGISADAVAGVESALVLREALPVDRIPGFEDGQASVQDASAQLAAELLDVSDGMRVLDACAAPGGKTIHLLERHDDLDLIAIDSDAARMVRVRENLDRVGLHARLITADAADRASWWRGKRFDRILLDAPCSGTGVIRRHPDIKWLRRESDIPALAAQQARLLEILWDLLKPGGRMVYATCSILTAEGPDVLRPFLKAHPEAQEVLIEAPWGEECGIGRRIAPGGAFDGFYYACLHKLESWSAGVAPT